MASGYSASREPSSRAATCPASPHEFAFEFVGLVGLADPLRASAAAAVEGMPVGRHPGRDDHGRLPGDSGGHRTPGGTRRRSRHNRTDARNHGRSRAEPGHRKSKRIRPDHARPEAQDRQRAEGCGRRRRHDRRRRQRRAFAQGRPHRRRDGRKGHGRGARSFRDRSPRRRLRLDRQGRSSRAADL